MFKGCCRMARAQSNGCVKNLVMFVYKGLGVGWPRNVERSQEARRNLGINSSTHGTHSQNVSGLLLYFRCARASKIYIWGA